MCQIKSKLKESVLETFVGLGLSFYFESIPTIQMFQCRNILDSKIGVKNLAYLVQTNGLNLKQNQNDKTDILK